jgi:hypothetical protein
MLEYLARALRQEKEIQEIQIRKKEIKMSLFPDDMIVYVGDPKNCTKNLLDFINTFSTVVGYKINIKKISATFLYRKNEQTEKEIRKTISITIASKKIRIN